MSNIQIVLVIAGSLMILLGSLGLWQQTALATLYFIANLIIFVGMR